MIPLHLTLVLVLTAFGQAAPTPQPRSDTTQSTNSTAGWSKEAIITLVGTVVAGICGLIALVTLIVVWPKLYNCIKRCVARVRRRSQSSSRGTIHGVELESSSGASRDGGVDSTETAREHGAFDNNDGDQRQQRRHHATPSRMTSDTLSVDNDQDASKDFKKEDI